MPFRLDNANMLTLVVGTALHDMNLFNLGHLIIDNIRWALTEVSRPWLIISDAIMENV